MGSWLLGRIRWQRKCPKEKNSHDRNNGVRVVTAEFGGCRILFSEKLPSRISCRIIDVIRNPESTKKIFCPVNPPGSAAGHMRKNQHG
jgi:hypothetical protein